MTKGLMRAISRFFKNSLGVSLLVATLAVGQIVPAVTNAQEAAPNVSEVLEPAPEFTQGLPPDQFAWAQVVEIRDEGVEDFDGISFPYQQLKVKITSGERAGEELELDHGRTFTIRDAQKLRPGDRFILGTSHRVDGSTYDFVADRARLPSLALLSVLFIVIVTFIAGRRGISAFLGLALSIAVLMGFVVPQIMAGRDPLFISILGATAIAVLSIYLAHGFRYQTTLALLSTVVTFVIAGLLAVLFVSLTGLTGSGSEQAYLLQLGQAGAIDLRGLLLGGIIIGTLGVLDDITTAQTAAVAELKLANPALTVPELYRRGLNIGREHILSLVNTLVLAYAGASLPIFLFFELNTTTPWWVILNGEFLAEEIVRTLIGSLAIVLAVPLTTLIAAYAFSRQSPSSGGVSHVH